MGQGGRWVGVGRAVRRGRVGRSTPTLIVTVTASPWPTGPCRPTPDVFDHEPLPDDHPLRTLPNVLALPHLGYVTRRDYVGYFQQAVEGITAFLAGSPIRQLG